MEWIKVYTTEDNRLILLNETSWSSEGEALVYEKCEDGEKDPVWLFQGYATIKKDHMTNQFYLVEQKQTRCFSV